MDKTDFDSIYEQLKAENKCCGIVNMSAPTASETNSVPWHKNPRTTYLYKCPMCHETHRIVAHAFVDNQPTPGRGSILCGRPLKSAERLN